MAAMVAAACEPNAGNVSCESVIILSCWIYLGDSNVELTVAVLCFH